MFWGGTRPTITRSHVMPTKAQRLRWVRADCRPQAACCRKHFPGLRASMSASNNVDSTCKLLVPEESKRRSE